MGEPMAGRRLEIDLPDELWQDLERVAAALGFADPGEASIVGLAEWVARRKAELEDRDPATKYFINEALDELTEKKKPH
jgi:hypothetical protein